MAAPDTRPPTQSDKFRTVTCLRGKNVTDPLLGEILREVSQTSLLDTIKSYIDQLHGTVDNNARPFQKLARLFEEGITPERIDGHHDGVAVGIRTGDEEGLLASYGNFMGLLWSTSVGPVAPWVGKSFDTVDSEILMRYTDGIETGAAPTCLGINHFDRLDESTINQLSLSVLTLWMHLKQSPPEERDLYGHDRDGGLFVARKAHSAYDGTDRDVFQLNYRWANLGNLPPFTYLIDELVEIADGVCLGQLLFATSHLLGRFDPNVPTATYRYQHFGYFLLMDDSWAAETRRVFRNIKTGRSAESTAASASGAHAPVVAVARPAAELTTLTLADPPDGNCNDLLFREVREDLRRFDTVLDLLKFYSDQLMSSLDNRSQCFPKLGELFNRGIGPEQVRGYYRGALISFHSEGFYRLFNVNTLDIGWKLGRFFSPWTGKTFETISTERLIELTDGFEQNRVPTFWGTNTVAFKTTKEKFVGQLMKLAGMPSEPVGPDETRRYGYDLKTFFFIARKATSINENNKGKKVFQFNYRWPKLGTFPPDNYCVDELVMVAEGLYLGQLIYATELLKKYDPREDPFSYGYRLFGYFLLMDEKWQKRRLQIGLDPYDVGREAES
jgi:hypothetical protein